MWTEDWTLSFREVRVSKAAPENHDMIIEILIKGRLWLWWTLFQLAVQASSDG
jgi:hypothetical protein